MKLDSLGSSFIASGSTDPEGTVGTSYRVDFGTSLFLVAVLISILTVLCSHEQVIRKALVHELHISYCHVQWNLLFSLNENCD